jgi:DNA modification methylase
MTLTDKYVAPPLSVLDVKQSYWKNRRKEWLSLGIESELGRNENLLQLSELLQRKQNGTSIFDPVLCECMYLWFSKENDKILDCFAGGSVRGIVASKLNRHYTGVDLSKNQIGHNIVQANAICDKLYAPKYINSNSVEIDSVVKDKYNLLFSCPPYFNLEVYSEDPADISTMNYEDFTDDYSTIIKKSVNLLEDDSFAVFVVGEVRKKDSIGENIGFVQDTIKHFKDAGCLYYNEMILLQEPATAAMRSNNYMDSSRKIAKCHQNVLVFVKGDPKKAVERMSEVKKVNVSFEKKVDFF